MFFHGQLYVAASRVHNFDSLRILVSTKEIDDYRQWKYRGYDQEDDVCTKNFVLGELLR